MLYSIVARSDPPTLTWLTTIAVSTAQRPCNGKSRTLVMAKAATPATLTRKQ